MRTYSAHLHQSRFHRAVRKFDIVLFNGGRGSGKTTAGAIQAIMEALEYQPGERGVVLAPTYPMLEDATMYELFNWLPRQYIAEYNRTRHVLRLANGSEIAFRSADKPDTLRGPNRAWAWLDEPRNLRTREAFDIVMAQLRPARKMWLTSTPGGMFHWMYKVFVEDPLPNSKAITVKTTDNPYLPEDFENTLRTQYTGNFAAQELDALWVSFEGLIYPEFDPTLNVTPAADYDPAGGPLLWGCDDGYAEGHERVVLIGQRTKAGGVNVFWEYSKCFQSYDATIDELLALPYPRPQICSVGIDSPHFRGELHKRGVGTSPGNDSKKWNVENGIRRLRQLICDGQGVRLLKVHPRCTCLVAGIQSYRADDHGKPVKENDNEVDALRYLCRYV